MRINFLVIGSMLGLPWWLSGKNKKQKPRLPVQETQVQSLGRGDPLEKKMETHSVFLPGKPYGQRSLAGYSPGGHKESDRTEHARRHMVPGRLRWYLWQGAG